mmetsp:Transcript_7120/g.31320  ORF Transcript_7120/g.31320 Transcript_7120/m.31320 type:complete len:226 (+) Transcript_7120:166-843(+)
MAHGSGLQTNGARTTRSTRSSAAPRRAPAAWSGAWWWTCEDAGRRFDRPRRGIGTSSSTSSREPATSRVSRRGNEEARRPDEGIATSWDCASASGAARNDPRAGVSSTWAKATARSSSCATARSPSSASARWVPIPGPNPPRRWCSPTFSARSSRRRWRRARGSWPWSGPSTWNGTPRWRNSSPFAANTRPSRGRWFTRDAARACSTPKNSSTASPASWTRCGIR